VAHTTWEAEIGRITVQSQPGRLYLENTHHKKGLVELGSSSNPSTRKQKKNVLSSLAWGAMEGEKRQKKKNVCLKLFFFLAVLGFQLRAYTLSHSTRAGFNQRSS
jgi:uncharacterized membrane protein YbjE (DUF340 family)